MTFIDAQLQGKKERAQRKGGNKGEEKGKNDKKKKRRKSVELRNLWLKKL